MDTHSTLFGLNTSDEPGVHLRLNNFEGPFDLLYHLIEKNEMDIYDIDINQIAIQYIDSISNMEQLDLDIASAFLVMAATLLHIKSRMLLPARKSEDEDEKESDPREELVVRLLEYKRYKAAAVNLKNKEELWANCIYKVPENIQYKIEYDNQPMSLSGLKEVYIGLKRRIVQKTNRNTSIISNLAKHEMFTVKNKLIEITDLFKKENQFNFNIIFDIKKRERPDVICGFLAILNLAKFHKIKVDQNKYYDDIFVKQLKQIDLNEMDEIINTAMEE